MAKAQQLQQQAARGAHSSGKHLIVHPRFVHTLPVLKATATFESLPPCVLHRICSTMKTPAELVTFSAVSQRCRHAASDDEFWRKMLLDRFGWVPQHAPPSWKALYRYQHELFVKVVLKQAADTFMNTYFNRSAPAVPLGFAINVM